LIVLAAISLLSWRKRGRQIILVLTLFLYTRYLVWRGLYTLNTGDWSSLLVSWTVYTAELYAFIQVSSSLRITHGLHWSGNLWR
jgi:hypothetical protein